MNAVLLSVLLMLVLSLGRMHVMLAMIIAAFAGGLLGGLDFSSTMAAFNKGIGSGAGIALSYAMLGGFAVAISLSGLPNVLANYLLEKLNVENKSKHSLWLKPLLLLVLLIAAMSSQNIIPIHIAFIPILIPPLLLVFTKLKLDRRLIACLLTFGLIMPYMFIPVGFGNIYLNDILLGRIAEAGMNTDGLSVVNAMALPALGMLIGLLIAIFFSYRKPREYRQIGIDSYANNATEVDKKSIIIAGSAILITFVVQLYSDSMVLGAMAGFLVFSMTGVVKFNQSEDVLTDGIKMMASIGFIMIAAAGFAEVLKATGHIDLLVEQSAGWLADNKALASFILLLVGLLLTIGIGSSFSTVPIIAAIYVPLCLQMGFSPLAIVSLVGTAGVLGDAGSPASDSTLGPTAGLNVDGQHNHMRDTVIPTFLHYNLPLLVFGWIAAMIL